MNYQMASIAVKAAIEESNNLKAKMNIAVVDVGANLVYFVRMDKSYLGSVDISIKKAKTSVMFQRPTGELGKISQSNREYSALVYGIEHSNQDLVTFPGGIPIYNNAGDLIGGIGVSGSSIENDHKVAEAGIRAITE
jgi:uncharacterized protein GlcG (DUF336 family)